MLGLDRNLWFLFALNIAVGFSAQIVQPLFPLYLRNLSATEMEIGLVVSLAGFAAVVLMLPSGLLMDRIGKKRMLLLSVILGAVPPFFIVSINDWMRVVPFFMLFSASFSFFAPARMAMIADNARPEKGATIFGLMNIAWPIAGIFGPFMSGYIVENFGWGYPFFTSGVIMSASVLPTLMLRERAFHSSEDAETTRKTSLTDRRYLPTLLLFFAFHLAMTTGLGGVNTILPIFLQDQLGLSTFLIGLFFTGSSFLTLFTQIPSGLLADRYGRKRLTVACIAFIPIFFGVWPFIDNWVTLLVLYSVAMGFWSMTWPATLALLSDSVPPELRGSAFGVRMTGVRLGFTIGPLISGYLYSTATCTLPFLVSAILIVMGIPFALLLKEGTREPEEGI